MENKTVKTLPVEVYRPGGVGDCTNGGTSASRNTLYLVCDKGWLDKPATDPGLIDLVYRRIAGELYLHAEPVNPDRPDNAAGPMFGGNFVYTSDSRFPAAYPIPVHDRYEVQERFTD